RRGGARRVLARAGRPDPACDRDRAAAEPRQRRPPAPRGAVARGRGRGDPRGRGQAAEPREPVHQADRARAARVRAALVIAAHHLKRLVRSPGRVALFLAIPVTIAAIEYAAFGRTAAQGKLPPIPVLVLDEDKTFAANAVPQVFAGGPVKEFFE